LSDGPITPTRDGLRVAIRLMPRARADRLVGIVAAAEGEHAIKASVTAPPQGGRANVALLQLLARAWGLRRGELSIVAGAASRNKTVHVAGDPPHLLARLAGAIAGLPGL
jgi:uncharacterized protein (TIGR00251 family)